MPAESSDIKLTRSHHTVVPGVETPFSIHTYPGAVCHLFHDEFRDQRLQLDADDNGVVRFHLRALRNWKPVEIHLQYAGEGGASARHTLAIRGDNEHGAPISPNHVAASPAGSLRPALEGDPMALSNQELLARGFPRRPDPNRSPGPYARWQRIVTRPYTVVSSRRVPHPGVSFSSAPRTLREESPTLPLPPPHPALTLGVPAIELPRHLIRAMFNSSSSIWSGATLTKPITEFCAIQADWNVPAVIAFGDAPIYSAAAEWIGLDNSATDLFQSGTDSECLYLAPFGLVATNYWMWIERLPFFPSSVPGLSVSPGDSMTVYIFVANQSGITSFQDGKLIPFDNSVWFQIYNNTQQLQYWGTLPASAVTVDGQGSTPFTGSTAEFIVERPTANNGPVPLAFFMMALMSNCCYQDAAFGDDLLPLAADGSVPADGSSLAYLNMKNPATNHVLDGAFGFAPPDSGDPAVISWIWTAYQ